MKYLFLFLFLILVASQPNAQIVFSKVYDLDEHMDNAARTVPIDGHLISVGFAENMLDGVSGFGVIKTDLLGNKIWHFTIDGIEKLKLNVVTYDENFVYAAITDFRSGTPE